MQISKISLNNRDLYVDNCGNSVLNLSLSKKLTFKIDAVSDDMLFDLAKLFSPVSENKSFLIKPISVKFYNDGRLMNVVDNYLPIKIRFLDGSLVEVTLIDPE